MSARNDRNNRNGQRNFKGKGKKTDKAEFIVLCKRECHRYLLEQLPIQYSSLNFADTAFILAFKPTMTLPGSIPIQFDVCFELLPDKVPSCVTDYKIKIHMV